MKTKDDILNKPKPLNRRRFLGLGAAALALPFLGRLTAFASPGALDAPLPLDRGLSFYNTHTAETADLEYCQSGCLVPESLKKINHILRDTRTGDVKDIDVRLLDLLNTLARTLPTSEPFHIISGYRSPDHERLPADARRGRGRLQQPPSRRQGHRYPRPGRQAPGPLQDRRRPEGRRRGDLSRDRISSTSTSAASGPGKPAYSATTDTRSASALSRAASLR